MSWPTSRAELDAADEALWALDLDSSGNYPELAHLIVDVEDGGEAMITACGERLTAASHCGWWSVRRGSLALSEPHNHCGGTHERS